MAWTAGPEDALDWVPLTVSGGVRWISAAWLERLETPEWCDRSTLVAWREADGCTCSPDVHVERDLRGQRPTGRRFQLWPACFIHDIEYSDIHARGTRQARAEADGRLRRNLRLLLTLQGMDGARADSWAWIYWGRTRNWGAPHYPWGPDETPEPFWRRFIEVWK